MARLTNFDFYSMSCIEDDINETNFVSKGYVDNKDNCCIWYFKNDNEYKFIIKDNSLLVYVNESVYSFESNKKTESLIKIEGYLCKVSVFTSELIIEENEIRINYILDFNSFKGSYKIIVKLC